MEKSFVTDCNLPCCPICNDNDDESDESDDWTATNHDFDDEGFQR